MEKMSWSLPTMNFEIFSDKKKITIGSVDTYTGFWSERKIDTISPCKVNMNTILWIKLIVF